MNEEKWQSGQIDQTEIGEQHLNVAAIAQIEREVEKKRISYGYKLRVEKNEGALFDQITYYRIHFVFCLKSF